MLISFSFALISLFMNIISSVYDLTMNLKVTLHEEYTIYEVIWH